MNLFVYSDESGVFDKNHNDWFVFSGIIFFSKIEKDKWTRKYISAESNIRTTEGYKEKELKANAISNKSKRKLFSLFNGAFKFGVLIDEKRIHEHIFDNKKTKQRYLDYAFKRGLKEAIKNLINTKRINVSEIDNIYIFVDEHTTATDGRYELREGIEEEFRNGTFNYNYDKFFPPILPNLKSVSVTYCNSATTTLIRGADIIANRLFYEIRNKGVSSLDDVNFIITKLP